jgi:hypothetical protein
MLQLLTFFRDPSSLSCPICGMLGNGIILPGPIGGGGGAIILALGPCGKLTMVLGNKFFKAKRELLCSSGLIGIAMSWPGMGRYEILAGWIPGMFIELNSLASIFFVEKKDRT